MHLRLVESRHNEVTQLGLLSSILLALHLVLWVVAGVLAWRHIHGEDTRPAVLALLGTGVAGIALSVVARLYSVATDQPPDSSGPAFVAALVIAIVWLRRGSNEAESDEQSSDDVEH